MQVDIGGFLLKQVGHPKITKHGLCCRHFKISKVVNGFQMKKP